MFQISLASFRHPVNTDHLTMEMNAVIIHGPGDIRVEVKPQPSIQEDYDAIVRVTVAGICGSELHPYRGHQKTSFGHTMVS